MPHAELEVELPGGEWTGGEQPKRKHPTGEPKVGGEKTTREPETGKELEVQTTLVPSGMVEVAPLQIDDSPLSPVWRCANVPPCGDDRV